MDNNYFYTREFRDKLEKKLDEPILPGVKTTFKELNKWDEMARASIKESNERKRIVAREKQFKKKVGLYGALGILAFAFVCCQIKQAEVRKHEEEIGGYTTQIGHNGEIIKVYNDEPYIRGGR